MSREQTAVRSDASPAVPNPALRGLPYAERIAAVAPDAPFQWLKAGWRDLCAAPLTSIGYGAMFVVLGLLLTIGLWWAGMLYLVTPLIAGFLIIAPLLAVGLYDVSRHLENGERPSFPKAIMAWRRNAFHILTAGLVLMLFLMIWVRLAALIFALFFPYTNMSLGGLIAALVSPEGMLFLAVGTAVGGILAAIAFVCAAVSLPLMLDHRVDIFTAALVSALAVFANLKAMVIWAALIVTVTVAGLLSGMVGLAVTLPVVGHATWHAYRALVHWDARPEPVKEHLATG